MPAFLQNQTLSHKEVATLFLHFALNNIMEQYEIRIVEKLYSSKEVVRLRETRTLR